MRDNTTSQPAAEYDANVAKTIPLYHLFHEQTLDLAAVLQPNPVHWLDCGCGTGNLVAQAIPRFPQARFTLADPSGPMIDLAKQKLANELAKCEFIQLATEKLQLPSEKFDLITAIMSHHYLPPEGRQQIAETCLRLLKPGGAYINFETIRPSSEKALSVGLKRWRQAQLAAGKSEEAVTKHIQRYGIELVPLFIADHLNLLNKAGFSTVELFWTSYLQAGFYAIK
jgi:tRNA (cmo5U34)-methyltransferase